MLRIKAANLENIFWAMEDIVESSKNHEKLRKHSFGIPKTLFQEFIEVTRILVTPTRPSLGQLVVITGIDKSGKETQAFNPEHKVGIFSLYDYFVSRAFKVLKLTLPSYYTTFGSLIASYLGKEKSAIEIVGNLSKDIAWVLWSLDRAQHNPQVEKWLGGDAKNIVLSKRWTETNMAYQKPLGISEKRILQFERNIVKADYTIVLEVPFELIFQRMETSGELPDKYETPQFLSRVSDIYKNLEDFYPYGRVVHVNGSGSFEEVNKRVLKVMPDNQSSWTRQAVFEKSC